MAQFPIIVSTPTQVGEVSVIKELDLDGQVVFEASGIILHTTPGPSGPDVCEVVATIGDISVDSQTGLTTVDVDLSTADLLVDKVPLTRVIVGAGAPAVIDSIVFSDPLVGGELITLVIQNDASQSRDFIVFDPSVAYNLPESLNVLTLQANETGIISFVTFNSLVCVSFKGGFI